MTDFEKQVLADLAELKANMRWLVGNGRAGVIQELTERVEQHERFVQRAGGVGAVIAGLLTLLHVAVDYLKLYR
jgi:hypothetical protein